MISKCPFQSDMLETASNSSNDMHPKHPSLISDNEFTVKLQKHEPDLLSPFSPLRKTEGNACSAKHTFAYFPESQPTSESTSLNSQPAFNLFHPAGPSNTKVYDYVCPPRQGPFSSLDSSTDEHTSEKHLLRPQNLNVIINQCLNPEVPAKSLVKPHMVCKENKEFSGL
jgi:hypothetical protein